MTTLRQAAMGVLLAALALPNTAAAVGMVPESFASIAKATRPAVVNIFSTKTVRVPGSTGDPTEDFFRQFFGQGLPPRLQRQQSLGSGFVISADGYIITNAHVVQQADEIRVKLSNHDEYTATLVGVDQKTDVALIKVKPHGDLPVVQLGDSDTLEVGDWVIAIGNPFGFSATVTAGIVSAKDRVIGAGPYDDFIQTDASINPGNSGGPLLNLKGEVVGINSAIYSRSGGNVGIGFAIPINLARTITDELRRHGTVARGWLGLSVQDMTPEVAESFGLDHPRGALVAEVQANSPAETAGIQRGDVILEFNGTPIEESRQLPTRVAEMSAGKTATLKVLRNGNEREITVTVAAQPSAETTHTAHARRHAEWGLVLTELTPDLLHRFDIPRNLRGAMIRELAAGEPAADAGLQPGDVIRQVDRRTVTSAHECQQLLDRAGAKVLLLVQRGQSAGYVVLERDADEP